MTTKRLVNFYALLNHPVGDLRPHIVKILPTAPHFKEVYDVYKEDKDRTYLTKREVERLWTMPATGPRYVLLPFSMWLPAEDVEPTKK